MRKLRKGFTLIELLVVIEILSALSAAMMISSSSAIASAKAAAIVSNLQAIKTGAIVFYTDYRDVSADADFSQESFYKVSNDYLDEATIKMINKDKRYTFVTVANGTGANAKPQTWYAGYALNSDETDNAQVIKKLAARAENFGLFGGSGSGTGATKPAANNTKYTWPTKVTAPNASITTTSTAVWMRVR